MAQNRELGELGQIVTVNTASESINVGNTVIHTSGITVGNTSLHSNGITIGGVNVNGSSFSGTSNNTLFVGSVSAANVVSNAQLQSNLANYLPLTGGTITGDLIVTGTTFSVNTTTLDVKDLNITVAKGAASAAAANGAGITVDGASATLTYDNVGNTWTSSIGLKSTNLTTTTNTVTIGTSTYFLSNGSVGIGTTTLASTKLVVNGNIATIGGAASGISQAAGTFYYDIANDYAVISSLYNGVAWKPFVVRSAGMYFKTSSDVEAMRIDNAGNVGIGTAPNPAWKVVVDSSSLFGSGLYDCRSNTNFPVVGTNRTRSGTTSVQSGDILGRFMLSGWTGTSTAGAHIEGIASGTISNTALPIDMRFSTVPSGSVVASERMRITADGNVGIGTSSPTNLLHLKKTGQCYLDVEGSTQSGFILRRGDGSNGYAILRSLLNDNSQNFAIYDSVNAATRFYINNSGGVGIGTTTFSVGSTLEVAGNAYLTTPTYAFLGVNSGTVQAQFAANAGGTVDVRAVSNHPMTFFTNNAERMRITSGGDVGIGTSTINARLALGALVSNKLFSLYDDGTNQYGMGIAGFQYRLFAADNASVCLGQYNRGTDTFTERMRIDASGNVGIGTNSPAYKLDVAGAAKVGTTANHTLRFGELGTLISADTHLSHNFYYNSGWAVINTAVPSSSIKLGSTTSNQIEFLYAAANSIAISSSFSFNSAGVGQTSGSWRSPVFYDSDNTAYYVDAASTSNLNGLTINSALTGLGANFTNDIRIYRNGATNQGVIYFAQTGDYYLHWTSSNFYFNGGFLQSTGSMRSPIFYDSDNTGYYVDAASTSNLNQLQVIGLTVGQGQTSSTITMFDSDNGNRFIHANSGRLGFLNLAADGWWAWNDNAGNWFSASSMRSPIFYDSDNTAFFVDAASTSNMHQINAGGGTQIVPSPGSGVAWFSTAAYGVSQGDNRTHFGYNASGTYVNYIRGSYTEIHGDARSPIFYDSNNTGYFINPDGTSVQVSIDLRGKINFPSGSGGGTTFSANHYSMGEDIANGGWSHPHYSDLIIGYHTGIRIGAHYSGVRFYSDSPTTDANNDGNGDNGETLIMTVGGHAGSHSFVIAHASMRSPIFYDSDNTTYYTDPASGSRLGGLVTFDTAYGSSRLQDGMGFVINGNYTNGLYSHRFRKWDEGNGVPMYVQYTTGTIGTWTNIAKFGPGGNGETAEFSVFGFGYATGSWRAPIFYDSDDTARFIDPANGGFNLVGGTSNRVSFICNDSGIFVGNAEGNGVNHVRLGAAWGRPGVYSPTYLSLMADGSQYIEFVTNNVQRGYVNNSSDLYIYGSMRSGSFIDNNDSAWYVDPAGYTRISALQSIGTSGNWNTDFQNTPSNGLRYTGDLNSGTNCPTGGGWWFLQNYRHSNSSNFWGVQVAWGWEDRANELYTRNVSGNSFGGWTRYWNSANAPGAILQVQQTHWSGVATVASSSFVNHPNLSVSITPRSTSSRILIMVSMQATVYNLTTQLRFTRNDTPIGIADAAGSRVRSTFGALPTIGDGNHQWNPWNFQFLDSPGTTAALTYRIQLKMQGGTTAYLNRSINDADNTDWAQRTTSTITVMEIAS